MINPEKNLIQRVRVISIALVTIIGFATVAMKPAAAPFDHKYGVMETADGTQWEIVADVTDPTSNYTCADDFETACTIGSNLNLSPGDRIPINESEALGRGLFEPF